MWRNPRKGSEIFLLKCKQLRVYKVSVNTVRVLYGVMVARRAAGGYVVVSSNLPMMPTRSTQGGTSSSSKVSLHAMIQSVRSARTSQMGHLQHPTSIAASRTAPICPAYGAAMVKRIVMQGLYAGSEFWGWPKYPACRGNRLPLITNKIKDAAAL